MLQDEKLANIIYGGSEVIHSILNKYTGFEIPKNYSRKYPGHDLIKTTGMLVSNLPEAAGIGMLDINQIAVDFISHTICKSKFACTYRFIYKHCRDTL